MGEQCIQELPEERQGKLLEGNDEHVRKSKPINSLQVDLGLPGPEHSSDMLSDRGFTTIRVPQGPAHQQINLSMNHTKLYISCEIYPGSPG